MNVEEFYKKYKDRLYKYVYKRISNKSDVDDIVQEIMLKVTNNMNLYEKNKGKFSNFVLLNANQVIIDYYRRTIPKENRTENLEDKDYKSNYDYLENIDEEYGLDKIIQKLPKSQREVIELVYINGLSYRDCSRLIGKSESSVKSLLFRARNNLKKIIEEENPEIVDKYFGRNFLKILVLSIVSVGMITGLAYAIIKFYNENKAKETYTLNELREKVPEDMVEVSRSEALEFIKKYDNIILERDLTYTEDDLELVKNYKLDKICWKYECEDYQLYINADSGEFVEYTFLKENNILSSISIEEILKQITSFSDYELYAENKSELCSEVVYAKKYGTLYNLYENIKVVYTNEFLVTISILDCEYIDEKVKISKEEALKLCGECKNDNIEIELCIENVNNWNEVDNVLEERLTEVSVMNNEIHKTNYIIRKVWKVNVEDKNIFYVDVESGEIYLKDY